MITNADITIFNVRYDKEKRLEFFVPTKISKVSFHGAMSTGGDAGEREEKLTYRIRIPFDAGISDDRAYTPAEIYRSMTDDEAKKYWTIQKGCYILLGAFPDLGEEAGGGVVNLDQIRDMQRLQEYQDKIIVVTEYADNTIRGSDTVKHWRIGGS